MGIHTTSHYIHTTFTLHLHYIHTTFTLHLHIDGASSRSFERHFSSNRACWLLEVDTVASIYRAPKSTCHQRRTGLKQSLSSGSTLQKHLYISFKTVFIVCSVFTVVKKRFSQEAGWP